MDELLTLPSTSIRSQNQLYHRTNF